MLSSFPQRFIPYYPRQVLWEVTTACNMNCKHCMSRSGKPKENELTLEECLNVAEQLVDMGTEYASLIGGEIFLYKDWHKISKKLIDKDVYVNILTNGYNIGDEQMEQLRLSGIAQVGLSIDGMEKSHNALRRNPRAFEHINKSIAKLKKENYSLAVETTLTNDSFHELEEMYKFMLDNDIETWQIQVTEPVGNASDNLDIIVQKEKIPLITKFVREKNKENKIMIVCGDNIGYFNEDEPYIRDPYRNYTFDGCQAGMFTVGIDSMGNVKGCQALCGDEFIEGNLRKNSLREIWNKEGAFAYTRNFDMSKLDDKCQKCDKAKICKGGCRQFSAFSRNHKFSSSVFCCHP